MTQECELDYDTDGQGIPYDDTRDLAKALPYGHIMAVMTKFVIVTGPRFVEIGKWRTDRLIKGRDHWYLFWYPGKNQGRQIRKEIIPDSLVQELVYCRAHYPCPTDYLFPMDGNSYRRRFNREIRQTLPKNWQKKKPKFLKDGTVKLEYVLQLKGFRKNFQTVVFKAELDKWNDSLAALEFTAKRMRYSDKFVSVNHYLANFETVQINKYKNKRPSDVLLDAQDSLLSWMV